MLARLRPRSSIAVQRLKAVGGPLFVFLVELVAFDRFLVLVWICVGLFLTSGHHGGKPLLSSAVLCVWSLTDPCCGFEFHETDHSFLFASVSQCLTKD